MKPEDAKVIYDTYLSYGWMGYPEIVDLRVFFDVQNRGVGNTLLDVTADSAYMYHVCTCSANQIIFVFSKS